MLRNKTRMRYDEYLHQGLPIASGTAEGACGHLVKDRMEQSAMRWTRPGAQAVLDLRAVRINDDWDAYQQFHRHCQHRRLYDTHPVAIPMPEIFAISQTAQVVA